MGVVVGVVLLAAVGCGKDKPVTSPPPTPTGVKTSATAQASVSPSVSGSASTLIEFTVDGAGPYQLGTSLTALKSGPGLDGVTAGGTCPDNTTAQGTGTWKEVQLSFHKDGKLYLAVNKSASIPTPSGAWLGTTLAQLKTIYVGVGGEDLAHAPGTAFLVTTLTGRGILFDLGSSQKVISMAAGDAAFLKATYAAGGNFC